MSLALPTLEFGTLTEVVGFLMEIDKLKAYSVVQKSSAVPVTKIPQSTVGTLPLPR